MKRKEEKKEKEYEHINTFNHFIYTSRGRDILFNSVRLHFHLLHSELRDNLWWNKKIFINKHV